MVNKCTLPLDAEVIVYIYLILANKAFGICTTTFLIPTEQNVHNLLYRSKLEEIIV